MSLFSYQEIFSLCHDLRLKLRVCTQQCTVMTNITLKKLINQH